MTGLRDIPTTSAPPRSATASQVVARIRAVRPGRRAVLRGLVIGAATATLVPMDWALARRHAGAQPADGGGSRTEHLDCHPADYQEEASNWFDAAPAVCYGGFRRGAYPCEGGFHREGGHSARDESYVSTRLTSACGGRNAWRWKGHRCSDAITTVTFSDGTEFTGTTIAACALAGAQAVPAPEPGSGGAVPEPEPEPSEPAPPPSGVPAPSEDGGAGSTDGSDLSRRRGGGLLGGLFSLVASR